MEPAPRQTIAVQLRTLAVAAVGGLAFALVGVPGGYLSGAILACAVAALAGLDARISQPMRNVALLMLGVVVGSTVTAETLEALPRWPLSLLALAVAMAALVMVVPRYLSRMHGLDTPTARLCAIPGAVSLVLALADELNVDERRVAVLQSLRLAILMMAVPLVVSLGVDLGDGGQAVEPLLSTPQLVALLGMAVAGFLIARCFGVPAPALTGAMLISGALFASGTVGGRLPEPLVAAAFIVLGASVGARFAGIDRAYLAGCLGMSAGGITLAVIITALIAWPAAAYLDLPFMQMWLAMAPGGFDTMVALALALGVDPAFVAGHQLIRLLGLFLIVPFLFRGARRAP
ncbi:AbrB family transcriptional regulator [Dichotomicrobium thermohalophilum]|uniref:Ammonia monooxygenase n=1 Tax=Dichotomicrobium thermohalophilum TaxID=933063 RepID=A0A397Q6I6_9HYPH|nr:AbrB family transcriptional regulator [Dichotomicrobium thermohalophilum]RIA56079.1 hypothetical protein BXY53_1175 [Dichotomicrobium thermohalophilum]